MSQDIPIVTSNPWHVLSVALRENSGDVVTWDFEFKWNYRNASWYFTLSQDNVVQAAGVRVVLGKYLGSRSRASFFFDSVLVAIDTSGKGVEAGLDDFGTRVVLRRFSVLEVILGRGFELGSPA